MLDQTVNHEQSLTDINIVCRGSCCGVSLSKTLYPRLSTDSTQEDRKLPRPD